MALLGLQGIAPAEEAFTVHFVQDDDGLAPRVDVKPAAMLATAVAAVSLTMLVACAEEGIVVERDSGRPLAGVVVVRTWQGSIAVPAQGYTKCRHFELATSDAEGRFRTAWRPFGGDSNITAAYRRGYHIASGTNYQDRIVMEPHAQDQPVRFQQIFNTPLPWSCPDTERLIEPILRPQHQEAMEAARTLKEFDWADGIMGAIETLTLGTPAASKNLEARRRQREAAARSAQRPGPIR